MKIYKAYFKPMWPVPHGLVIAAPNITEALKIAGETVKHTKVTELIEVKIDEPKVVFYESGDY